MFEKFKAFLGRIRVRLMPLVVAAIGALPYALEALGVIDIKPLLVAWLGDTWGLAAAAVWPFILTFMKSAVHLEPADTE